MSDRQSCFAQNPQLTFVNYGAELDLGYRTEARKHNARVRAESSSKNKRRHDSEDTQAQAPDATALSAAKISTIPRNARPQDALSSFRRDQLRSYPIEMKSDDYSLEAAWFSKFQDIFFLPQLPPHTQLVRPQEHIFKDSIPSSTAFLAMVLVAAGATEAQGRQELSENLLSRQAILLQHYRAIIEQFDAVNQPWRAGFRDLYAATFAFATEGLGKESALDKMEFSNFSIMARSIHKIISPIPMIEWVRTLLPVPGPTFHPDLTYQSYWNATAALLFAFLERAQAYAVAAGQSGGQQYSPFKNGTALRQIITTPTKPYQGRQPHPYFYEFCRLRLLTHLHLYVLESQKLEMSARDDLFSRFERLAAECAPYGGPTSVALFLWALMTAVDNLHAEIAVQEKFLSIPSKDLLVKRELSFADEMAAWLVQDRDQEGNFAVLLLDFNALSQTVRYPV